MATIDTPPIQPFKPSNPIELKIKAKTLAAEARIIKTEEQNIRRTPFFSKAKRIIVRMALELPIQKPQTELPSGHMARHGSRSGRAAIKAYIASLTPEQAERLQKRREAARARIHSLREHRIKSVRTEARATHLARAFLKGTPYANVEQKAYECPLHGNLSGIGIKALNMAIRYRSPDIDSRVITQKFEEWRQTGHSYFKAYWKAKQKQDIQADLKTVAVIGQLPEGKSNVSQNTT